MKADDFTPIPLADHAVIAASGPDARTFLQNQLTQDVHKCTPDQAVLTAWCTAQGRVLSTLILVQADPDEQAPLWLLLRRELADDVLTRLRRYVLRAKVTLALADVAVQGRAGDAGLALPLGVAHEGDGRVRVRTPGAPARHWVLGGPPDADAPTDGALDRWRAQDIQAGLPWIVAATQEKFTAQSLNLDLLDGLSFEKGCYPGQEVVARSHYRGTVKRRMAYIYGDAHAVLSAPPRAGDDIHDARRPDQPAGRIVNVASDGQRLHLLVEVHLADLATADYRLHDPAGPALQLGAQAVAITSAQA